MIPRFICPHCHSPIAPLAMEIASNANAQYRICPECDEPIVLFVTREVTDDAPPMAAAPEGCIL